MTKATKQSWHNLKAFTVDWQRVELNLTLDEAQMRNLEMGFIPPAMEYKWFIYFENNVLHLYRSWTGYKVAEVVFGKKRTRLARAFYETGSRHQVLESERGERA
ncbi:hypothetical protein P4907_04105 [Escherichia coli]